jgi:hypothetical protein
MNLLDLARSALPSTHRDVDTENTPPHPPVKTVISPFESKDTPLRECISANDKYAAEADPAIESRRQRVLAILAENPDLRYAVVTDTEAEPDVVVVHIGIRDVGSGEILIAKGSYDGIELLRLLESRRAEDQGGKEKA